MRHLIDDLCPLCGRKLGDANIDRHHLIPKCKKGKEQEPIHRICHRKIHSIFTERELEKIYYTWEKLKEHPEIKKFIDWVKLKPSEFYLSTKDHNGKRG